MIKDVNEMKKALSVFLSLLLCFSCAVVASADDDDFEIMNGVLYYYNGDDDKVVVPEGVTKLSDYCFDENTMTELVLPDSLEVIDDFALSWCENLKTVTIPKNVRQLGCYVFQGSSSLSAVNVAAENQYFKSVDGVLFDKSGEKLILFPPAKKATSCRVPDTVKTIDDGAFFQSALTEITVGDSVETVGSWAFGKCHGLTGITLGKNVKSMGGYVFSTCDKLQSVTLPASVNEVGECMFEDCTALQAINVEDGNKKYVSQDGVLYTKDKTVLIKHPEGKPSESFTLPATVKKLTTGSLTWCKFTSIDLSGVTVIQDYALRQCRKMQSVTLGAGLTSIGKGAFDYALSLRDVWYEGSSADWRQIKIQEQNDELFNAQKHFAGGIVFPEARDKEAGALAEGEEIPEIDTSEFSLQTGRDGGSMTGTWRYAYGQAYAYDSFFTLVTGPRSGEFLINFYTDGTDDAYRFTIEPWSAYRLTYTYGYSSGSGSDRETVEWFCENGSAGTQQVSVTGGKLHKGGLTEVTLLRQDDPPPHEHVWDEPAYVWSADNASVTATRVCSVDDSHVETETVNTTSAVTAATCTAEGKTTYTATFTNPAFTKQTKEVAIPATGHNWGEPTYTWSADNATVTAKRTCKTDPAHTETETVNTTSAVTAATCTAAGKTTYTAAFTNPAFTKQTKEVAIPATGHNWGEPTYTWSADNATVTATRTCRTDPAHVETETVNTTAETGADKITYTAVFTDPAFAKQTKDVPLAAEKRQAGDVDGNGKVESADARLALRASVGLEKIEKGTDAFQAADVTGDGVIKAEDARYILRASVKLEDLTKLKKTA